MTQLQAKIDKIIKSHPIPGEEKHKKNQERLMRMAGFYNQKAPTSKDGGAAFYGFVASLEYAINVIGMYRSLTKNLADLQEADDEARTNSTRG